MFERLIPNAAACYDMAGPRQQSEIATAMGFSPDIISTITLGGAQHSINILNVTGFIPGISTVSGTYRTLVGLAYLVKSLACCIFDAANRNQHLEGMKIGAANTGRGLLELIPFIGNCFTLNIDASRMMHRWADHGHPYGDAKTIPIIAIVDYLACIPVIGTIVSLARASFFAINVLVNTPLAITGNVKYINAVKFGATQVGIGLLESIPILGNFIAAIRSDGVNKVFAGM